MLLAFRAYVLTETPAHVIIVLGNKQSILEILMKHNVIKILEACFYEFLFITISCLVSTIIYGVLTFPFRDDILKLEEGTEFEKLFLFGISILMTVLFCSFLLFFKKKTSNAYKEEVLDDYKKKAYSGLWNEIKTSFVNGDYTTSILVILLNILAIIFAKAEFLVLWAPMFFFMTVISNSIIAHIVSIVVTLFTYYLFLGLYRREIYKKMAPKNQ